MFLYTHMVKRQRRRIYPVFEMESKYSESYHKTIYLHTEVLHQAHPKTF